MKKAYSTPDIAYESFALSTSIAACDEPTSFNKGTCGYRFSFDLVVFIQGVVGCETGIIDEDGVFNDICYDNPADMKNLFSS